MDKKNVELMDRNVELMDKNVELVERIDGLMCTMDSCMKMAQHRKQLRVGMYKEQHMNKMEQT